MLVTISISVCSNASELESSYGLDIPDTEGLPPPIDKELNLRCKVQVKLIFKKRETLITLYYESCYRHKILEIEAC